MLKLKWTRWLGAFAVVAATPLAFAADHRDATTLEADPSTDINDVYAWVANDKVTLVMTVFPVAEATSQFSDTAKYVFHTKAGASGLAPSEPERNIICTFASSDSASCWVSDLDYVTGDPSGDAGMTSDSGMLKVYAGLRDDPFFFNLDGFKKAISTVAAAVPSLPKDAFGCPTVDAPTSAALVAQLKGNADTTGPGTNFFAGLNVLAIVVEVDASLLTTDTAKQLTIWASTNQ
jgi:hypothetical protein